MSLAASGGQLIIKDGALATNCCCEPYVIASIVLEDGSVWDTSPYIGPGIAFNGGDQWRIAEVGWAWSLLQGCVEEDGSLNGMSKSFDSTTEEGIELPVRYGGAFEIQIGCWKEDEIKWPE
jgi:hypothetical protein